MAHSTGNKMVLQLRALAGETQAAMADRLGWPRATIAQIETGAHRLSIRRALQMWGEYRATLARAGYSLEDLLRGVDPHAPAAQSREERA